MKAMVLAAGHGSRLKPLTDSMPKCMMPVGGKPVLQHTLEHLRRFGVVDIIINLCHLAEVVMDYFGDGHKWGVRITYSIETEVLGTAGGVKNVEWLFDGPFFVWYGDNLSTCNLDRLYRFHRDKGGVVTIALYHRGDPTSSGIVDFEDQDRIARFLEKPTPDQVFSHWVNAGILVLEPEVLDGIPNRTPYDFGRDLFPSLLARGVAVYGYRMSQGEDLWWIDTPEDLRRVKAVWEEGE